MANLDNIGVDWTGALREVRRCTVCKVVVARLVGPPSNLKMDLLRICQRPLTDEYRCIAHPKERTAAIKETDNG